MQKDGKPVKWERVYRADENEESDAEDKGKKKFDACYIAQKMSHTRSDFSARRRRAELSPHVMVIIQQEKRE